MTEIRDIPVVLDTNRQCIVGMAQIKDNTITFTVEFQEIVKITEHLVMSNQLRCFMLGFQYFRQKEELQG